ncbi:ParB-like nuclease domain-containing protein [Rhodoblastus acidophilus]|uniref:ParB-like nuclease domain-containing protein n=1 Tax=Rhodoblastus acidophilus TaxID=1074 RepID=A0A212SGL4_RHOAC|nr:DUF6551 family protein [Rhodoblastus acidophilus]PPQ34753.1 hypothetical protein CKO16_22020 [Rhodoblastus acidophilus]RAI16546.1 hypothetical protein CH337_20825 [Rhodoblastus acidophilus]SNB84849.1 ParB-like nuclease domain-containing protein [Rhodoblastus acidophilus]
MSDLRPIDIADYPQIARPETFGAAPQLQWIKIAELAIDPDYQREITDARRKSIRAIAEHFNWGYFSAVMVSPVPGGRYAIIDGMGRTTAAALCGFDSVPCAVIIADKREQARAFTAVNGAVSVVRPLQRFKAEVAAGDPEAMRIKAVTDRAGVVIAGPAGGKQRESAKPNETFALDAIRRSIAKYGEATTEKALHCVARSCEAKGGQMRTQLIAAVALVLHNNEAWRDQRDLDRTFAGIDLDHLWREATAEAHTNPNVNARDVLCGMLVDALADRYDEPEAA